MAELTMPAPEMQSETEAPEVSEYECAFHILPTVAEEEVPAVVNTLKDYITKAGGTVTAEEAPEQVDLAYEITTQIEGMNRRFNAAYFGWVRFSASPAAVPELDEAIAEVPEVLRFLLVKLTKEEAAHPYYRFATARERAAAVDAATEEGRANDTPDPSASVAEDELTSSLEKITE